VSEDPTDIEGFPDIFEKMHDFFEKHRDELVELESPCPRCGRCILVGCPQKDCPK
jgi:hypothetical protein